MAFNTRTFLCGAFCLFITILQSSTAPLTSESSTGKEEPISRHKDVSVKKPVLSKVVSASKQKLPEKEKIVQSQPKVFLKPVPGLVEEMVSAGPVETGPQQKSSKQSKLAEKAFLQDKLAEKAFLQEKDGDEEQEREEEEEDLPGMMPDDDAYQPWQYLISDPRLQSLLVDNSRQQVFRPDPPRNTEDLLFSQAMADYLVRSGELDRTIDDLVSTGVMTPQEALMYREAVNLRYGGIPPASSDYSPQELLDPEVVYDDVSLDDAYDGSNYVQPLPIDYSTDYVNLPPPPPESFVKNEGGFRQPSSRFGTEDRTEDENDLLRDLLGSITMQEYDELNSETENDDDQKTVAVPAVNRLPTGSKNKNNNSNNVNNNKNNNSNSNSKENVIEKELELLSKTNGKTAMPLGTEEEKQLEEIGNRTRSQKTKQENRTKPVKVGH